MEVGARRRARGDRLPQRRLGLGPFQLREEQGETGRGVRVGGAARHRLAVDRHRIVRPAGLLQHRPEHQPGLGDIRVLREHRAQPPLGGGGVARRQLDELRVAQRHPAVVRVLGEQRLERGGRLRAAPQLREIAAAVEARLEEAPVQLEGAVDQLEGPLRAAAAVLDVGLDLQRLGAPRCGLPRPRGRRRRLVEAPQLREGAAQVAQGGEVVGVHLERHLDPLQGLARAALGQHRTHGLQLVVHRHQLHRIAAALAGRPLRVSGEVAQGAQLCLGLWVDLDRAARAGFGPGPALDRGRQPPRVRRAFGRQIAGLAGVALEVVQLPGGCVDELERPLVGAAQLGPAVGEEGHLRLGEEEALGQGAPTCEQRQQAAALELRAARLELEGQQLDQGRHQVDLADGGLDPQAGRPARQAHQPGDANGGVVDEQPVGLLAVLAEPLAVVAHRHHQRVPAGDPGVLEQARDLGVHVGDLAVVGPLGEALRPRGGRREGEVRVVEVDPQKVRGPLVEAVEPRQRPVRGVRGPALGGHPRLAARAGRADLVVVHLEAPIEAVARLEHDGRDEGGRAVAGRGQPIGEGRDAVAEVVGQVVADAVPRRVEAGEDRGVARRGDRRRGEGVLEDDPVAGEVGQGRRFGVRGAVGLEVVRAGRVEGDQEHRRAAGDRHRGRVAGALVRAAGAGGEERTADRGGQQAGQKAPARDDRHRPPSPGPGICEPRRKYSASRSRSPRRLQRSARRK